MKPLLSLFVLLVLFQTLVLGSLVKTDMQPGEATGVQGSLIHKTIVLDPFLLPDNALIHPTLAGKAEWFPFSFTSRIVSVSSQPLLHTWKLPYGAAKFQAGKHIPVFIFINILRL